MANYIDYLKKYEHYDKFILYLLALGMSVDEVAKNAQVTRQTVYNVIERNRSMVNDHVEGVESIDVTDDRDTGEQP